MKGYYELLGISLGASNAEIKKAYFKMVRKFPPDRFEEEFMEIREAYEVLSNEKTKKEYDLIASIPENMQRFFQKGKECMEEGNMLDAIKYFEYLKDIKPDLLIARSFLGISYLNNGNTGKGVKIFEELVKESPDNSSFAGHLANAYLARGFHKKAIQAYHKAIELDNDNIALWLGFAEAYMQGSNIKQAREIYIKAINLGKEKEWDDISNIYLRLILAEIMIGNMDEMNNHLNELVELAVRKEELRDNIAWNLTELSKKMTQCGLLDQAVIMAENVCRLLPNDEDIKKLLVEVKGFKDLQIKLETLKADKRFKTDISELISYEILPKDIFGINEEEIKAIIFITEFAIINHINSYKSDIKKLKEYYPELYKAKRTFFEEVMDSRKWKKMLSRYEKNMIKYERFFGSFMNFANMLLPKYFDEEEDDEDDEDDDDFGSFYGNEIYQETYVREEPKVGRNDPCPCGSGKKYKKCCGQNR